MSSALSAVVLGADVGAADGASCPHFGIQMSLNESTRRGQLYSHFTFSFIYFYLCWLADLLVLLLLGAHIS